MAASLLQDDAVSGRVGKFELHATARVVSVLRGPLQARYLVGDIEGGAAQLQLLIRADKEQCDGVTGTVRRFRDLDGRLIVGVKIATKADPVGQVGDSVYVTVKSDDGTLAGLQMQPVGRCRAEIRRHQQHDTAVVRERPSEQAAQIAQLAPCTSVAIISSKGDWFEIGFTVGKEQKRGWTHEVNVRPQFD